jgi:hypothetical protein
MSGVQAIRILEGDDLQGNAPPTDVQDRIGEVKAELVHVAALLLSTASHRQRRSEPGNGRGNWLQMIDDRERSGKALILRPLGAQSASARALFEGGYPQSRREGS